MSQFIKGHNSVKKKVKCTDLQLQSLKRSTLPNERWTNALWTVNERWTENDLFIRKVSDFSHISLFPNEVRERHTKLWYVTDLYKQKIIKVYYINNDCNRGLQWKFSSRDLDQLFFILSVLRDRPIQI